MSQSTPDLHPDRLPAALIGALERTGGRPALVWYDEAARIELSGHVLANWVIKSANHLAQEIALAPGDRLVLDLPPHWKRLVLALAGWMLGADVETGPGAAADPTSGGAAVGVLATDRPDSPLAEAAEEVLALRPLSLSLGFDAPLPPLVHDWAQEVRGSGDALSAPLARWSGPLPAPTGEGNRVLLDGDALDDPAQAPRALGALLADGYLLGPASALTAQQRRAEGV